MKNRIDFQVHRENEMFGNFLKALTYLVIFCCSVTAFAQDEGVIDAATALELQQAGTISVIDIRRPSEWRDTGIPKDGVTITMHDPDGHAAFLEKVLASVDGNRDAPIGLICASGVRSTWASGFLAQNGFTHVYNIKEGMLGRGRTPGWIKRGFPVETYNN